MDIPSIYLRCSSGFGNKIFDLISAVYLKNKYSDRISYIFGTGLIAGIIFKNPVTGEADALFPTKVCEKAMQKGVILVHTGRESIKMGPPLTIPDDALLEGLEVLEESIIEVAKDS